MITRKLEFSVSLSYAVHSHVKTSDDSVSLKTTSACFQKTRNMKKKSLIECIELKWETNKNLCSGNKVVHFLVTFCFTEF